METSQAHSCPAYQPLLRRLGSTSSAHTFSNSLGPPKVDNLIFIWSDPNLDMHLYRKDL